MPYSIRRVQNKNKKERKEKTSAEFQELRAENQKLRRENARLRRTIDKLSNNQQEEEKVESLADVEPKPTCPKCQSEDLTKLPIGPKILTYCRSCKWRKAA